MKHLEIYSHAGKEGYNPFLIREGWQVAQLNYLPEHGLDDIIDVEAHKETDEVFILFKGEAVLITAEVNEKEVLFGDVVRMKRGVTYNVPRGVWHNIAMNKEAEMIIVEKDNTHLNDCYHHPLSETERTFIYQQIEEKMR